MYLWQLDEWPQFSWNSAELLESLQQIYFEKGRLLGRMEGLGFDYRNETRLRSLTSEVIHTSLIEGQELDRATVRSSVARKLGIDIGDPLPPNRKIDGVVDMVLDATQNHSQPLSGERLRKWRNSLSPAGQNETPSIRSGDYRRDDKGPMQVVSGPIGRETIHYEAPPAESIVRELDRFILWFENKSDIDPIIKAGIAHLWFLTIHPFEDENGRIGRAVLQMSLARTDGSAARYYSISRQIESERREYYRVLEATQKGTLDIIPYLSWYLQCLKRALHSATSQIEDVLEKSVFWREHVSEQLNTRQIDMINHLFEDIEGNLTTTRWAAMTRVSQDTAHRDIVELIERGILEKSDAGGRSTRYTLLR